MITFAMLDDKACAFEQLAMFPLLLFKTSLCFRSLLFDHGRTGKVEWIKHVENDILARRNYSSLQVNPRIS